jgi:hypothetical protein
MLNPDEFRTGQYSIPSYDADDLPEYCFACNYLAYKEFSTSSGEGLFYYFCAYFADVREAAPTPPCLVI